MYGTKTIRPATAEASARAIGSSDSAQRYACGVATPAIDSGDSTVALNIPFPLLTDIGEGRCLPFVGAGFSLNAELPPGLRMPDWPSLTASLAAEAGIDAAGISPPDVASRYERRFGRVQLIEAVRRLLHPEKARPGKAHLAFAALPFDTVYTTSICCWKMAMRRQDDLTDLSSASINCRFMQARQRQAL
jgi:hypothetical protein